ncbi:hypothetical protein L2E44_24370, partial [Salmonella enterica subsp. enterica serovar Weltevreden]|uniref:hypothetical protein n=1 Tax=Salmonella enterica TaxID=28901 RepID=UPI001F3C65C4
SSYDIYLDKPKKIMADTTVFSTWTRQNRDIMIYKLKKHPHFIKIIKIIYNTGKIKSQHLWLLIFYYNLYLTIS